MNWKDVQYLPQRRPCSFVFLSCVSASSFGLLATLAANLPSQFSCTAIIRVTCRELDQEARRIGIHEGRKMLGQGIFVKGNVSAWDYNYT